jgi:peptide-methionine (R)-S-oxide reductase
MMMKTLRSLLVAALLPLAGWQCDHREIPMAKPTDDVHVTHSDKEWHDILTPEQYHVLREHGTERAFSGKYWDAHENAVYVCAGCGKRLFSSVHKFDSGTGWPSFWQPIDKNAVATEEDRSYGMVRVEVMCPRCGGHLGHVFDDGPAPTGLRYCINSAALKQVKPE